MIILKLNFINHDDGLQHIKAVTTTCISALYGMYGAAAANLVGIPSLSAAPSGAGAAAANILTSVTTPRYPGFQFCLSVRN